MKVIVDKVVEFAWLIWGLIVSCVILVAFITLLITVFALGLDCGIDDQCVERIERVVDAAME